MERGDRPCHRGRCSRHRGSACERFRQRRGTCRCKRARCPGQCCAGCQHDSCTCRCHCAGSDRKQRTGCHARGGYRISAGIRCCCIARTCSCSHCDS